MMAEKKVVKNSEEKNRTEQRNSTLSPGFKLSDGSEQVESESSVYQRLRSFTLGRRCKSKFSDEVEGSSSEESKEKKKGRWNLKFNYKLRGGLSETLDLPESDSNGSCSCVCTGYRRTEEHHLGAGVVFQSTSNSINSNVSTTVESRATNSNNSSFKRLSVADINDGKSSMRKSLVVSKEPVIDFSKFNPDDYPTEDCDEKARAERAWEMEEGVEPPPGYHPVVKNSSRLSDRDRHSFLVNNTNNNNNLGSVSSFSHSPRVTVCTRPRVGVESLGASAALGEESRQRTTNSLLQVHSQVDYYHCLVPDLLEISNCGFYWGKMDRYEAERLLENKPEGTFLLRDSAQEDYLFSVSFRRYGRSLHARIEQWNHKFSFDSHDPGVFSSKTVCGLIEHYKDPSCCMFFEPMLTIPLYRTFTFLLQHLCRSQICRTATYDSVNQLELPKTLKTYLKEYHYKQRVRLRRLDVDQ